MADWLVCPHCQLKHTRRPDGNCPRCKAAIDAVGGASPSDPERAAVPAAVLPSVYDDRVLPGLSGATDGLSPTDDLSTGARIAGGVLLLNGLLLLIEKLMLPDQGGIFSSPVSMLIDLGVGGMLVAGKKEALGIAKFRTIGGGLLFPAVHLFQGNMLLAGLQLVLSGSLAALLFGHASPRRIGAALSGVGLCLGLEVLGLSAIATGFNPLGRYAMASQLESQSATIVHGQKIPYRILMPKGGWYLRKEVIARRDNPLADRWVVRPNTDSHVIVIPEELPAGANVDMDRFADVVLANARKAGPNITLIDQESLSTRIRARLLHTRGTINGIEIESYYGLFVQEPYIVQVIAFSGTKHFDRVRRELRQIVESLEIP